ncbi:MAG TPA: tripartite tricarboxylate transporter substrate binding protein [Xanthobacteraceae bacterium]|nr:tripartite tricarboxylate transporter substrate binding protein [Xanthobacteraceae bacterium]
MLARWRLGWRGGWGLGLWLAGALAAGGLVSPQSQAQAQNYPSRAITMVVPFAAGGLTDVPARVLAAMMQERIGQSIVVENKPGGSGTVGGAYAARAAPDGYTLFANSIADAQNLHFLPVPYNAIDDFAMIGMIVEGPPLVLIIDAALPYKSLAELLADAQAQPKKLSFGTSGPATSPAMALAQLNALAKTEIAGVPYRGSGEAARNVAGGGIQGAFAFYAQAKPLADDGKVRALAIASPRRIATWPQVPTMEELGFPNFDYGGFVGLAAPAKTPAPIVDYLNKQLNDVVQSQAFRSRMEALGMTVPADNTPAGLADYMRRETVRQGALAALTGIKTTAPPP